MKDLKNHPCLRGGDLDAPALIRLVALASFWLVLLPGAALARGPGPNKPTAPGKRSEAEAPAWPEGAWVMPERSRGYLGVQLMRLTEELRAHFGAPRDAGVLVARVEPKSPAEQAGLKVGDVLTEVDGRAVDTIWSVQRAIWKKKENDRISLIIIRQGRRQGLHAVVKERKRPQIEVSRYIWSWPGGAGRREEGAGSGEVIDRFLERLQRQLKRHGDLSDLSRFFQQKSDLERRLKQMEDKIRRLEKKL